MKNSELLCRWSGDLKSQMSTHTAADSCSHTVVVSRKSDVEVLSCTTVEDVNGEYRHYIETKNYDEKLRDSSDYAGLSLG